MEIGGVTEQLPLGELVFSPWRNVLSDDSWPALCRDEVQPVPPSLLPWVSAQPVRPAPMC